MSKLYLSPPDLADSDHASLHQTLESGWVATVGPHLDHFECRMALEAERSHAVALNSGTAALHLALKLLGVGPGDQVICPSFTFIASANPITYCGAEPIFVDSECSTWNLDPELLERALKNETAVKAVICVHLYGQCAQMDSILSLCAAYGVPLIEDAAEALGARYRGRPAGSFGALSFYSFNGNKIITTSAGGMLMTDSEAWAQRAQKLVSQAREEVLHYEHLEVGYNYRMSNILAALGLAQLDSLERRVFQRKIHFIAYREQLELQAGLQMMPIHPDGSPNYWLTCLTVDPAKADASPRNIIEALAAENIEARPLWKPLHMQPVFKGCVAYLNGVSEALYATGLCLPSGSNMLQQDRQRVIDCIVSCLKKSNVGNG